MTHSLKRNRTTWLAYLVLTLFGYCLNSLGPLTPFLKSELNVSYAVASLHFTAFAVGIIVMGLGGSRLIDRLGRMRALWLGSFGLSLGTLLLLLGRDPMVTIATAFVMGLFGALILAIVPATLNDLHGERRAVALTEANLLASCVAAAAPLLIGWFARTPLGWRPGLGLITLLPVVVFLWMRPRAETAAETRVATASATTTAALPVLYWVYWTALVFGVATEFCMVFWSADFLENVRGLTRADAAQAVSLFFFGMIVGRLLISVLAARFANRPLVIGSLVVASMGFALYWQASLTPLALAGLFVTGLGVAGLYPLIMAMVIEAAGANVSQGSARATLATGVAISILPLVLGRLADSVGIAAAYGVVAALLTLTLSIIGLVGRRRGQEPAGAFIPQDHGA